MKETEKAHHNWPGVKLLDRKMLLPERYSKRCKDCNPDVCLTEFPDETEYCRSKVYPGVDWKRLAGQEEKLETDDTK